MSAITVIPALRISSRATLDFYVRAFGAELVAAHPPEGDDVAHAELRLGGGSIMCGTGREGGLDQPPGGSSTYWVLDRDEEVDAVHARATAAGAVSVFGPHDESYGGRHCTVRDPDGNAWTFGTYRGAADDH